MGATITISPSELAVEPGDETTCEVRLRNTGEVVDQFTVDVVGDATGWVRVEPALVNLLPGDEATVLVAFSPPRSSDVLAGTVSFGVRVRSREDPHGSTVEQGDIEVARFVDWEAELVPVTRRGRRRARYRLAVDNLGNHEHTVGIVGIDPEDALDITVASPSLLTGPGTASIVRTTVAPLRRFWRGEAKTHPFQMLVQTAEPESDEATPEPLTVAGVMIQDPLLPKWLFKAALVAVVAIVALVAFWFTLLKPTVESVAREQAAESADQAAERANDAADRADEAAADTGAGAGDGQAGGDSPGTDGGEDAAGAENGGAEDGGADDAAAAGGTSSTSFRIQATADPVDDGSFSPFEYTAPAEQALQIADLVLQNPRGDSGFLRIALDGDIILEVGLANFRDLDYHYVVPLYLEPGKKLVFLVNCEAPGSAAQQCTPSASFSGTLTKPPTG